MSLNRKIIIIILVLAAILAIAYFAFILSGSEEKPDTDELTDRLEIPPMPQTLDEAEELLDSPQILQAFLNEYFVTDQRPDLFAYAPEEFFEKRKGAVHDFAVFSAHILRHNRLEAGIIRFNYQSKDQEGTHTMVVFRDKDNQPKYFTATESGCLIFPAGTSFKESVIAEAERLKVIATEYAFFPAGITDLGEPATGYKWIEIKYDSVED